MKRPGAAGPRQALQNPAERTKKKKIGESFRAEKIFASGQLAREGEFARLLLCLWREQEWRRVARGCSGVTPKDVLSCDIFDQPQ